MPLRELFDEVATHDEPVSRLTPDGVYTTALRQRRLATTVRVAAATLGVFALAGTAFVAVGPGGPGDRFGGDGVRVHWVGAADPDHLYALVAEHEGPIASTDGGRTWAAGGPVTASGVVGTYGGPSKVAGPGRLAGPLMSDGGYFSLVSVNGGRAWSKVVKSTIPVQGVPPGALILCAGFTTSVPSNGPITLPETCTVDVLDLDRMVFAPLATQPDLEQRFDAQRTQDGTIWAVGRHDRSAPAIAGTAATIASSTDGGRTWSTEELTGLPDLPTDRLFGRVGMASRDGRTVHLGIEVWSPTKDSSVMYRYRRVAGGDWQRLEAPGHEWSGNEGASYVTPDGTHVVGEYVEHPSGDPNRNHLDWWACRPGAGECESMQHPARLPDGSPVEVRPDGGFVTNDGAAAYLSTDGWSWRRIEVGRVQKSGR